MSHAVLSRPTNIGIVAMEVYFPSVYVGQSDLEEFDGASKGKYTIGLGQERMGFCYDNEDVNSLALTVVSMLMRKHGIDYKDVGRLEVGTETLLDKSKSVKSVLMQLFEDSGNFDVEGIDTKNACYGGTSALFNSVAWIESSAWDGRKALVVCADIAVYAKGSARCTGGAGAIAMLVGPDAPVVLDPGLRGSYMRHSYDFFKPNLSSEYPVVDGKLSVESYITALNCCFDLYCHKAKERITNGMQKSFSLSNLDYMIFHCPYAKLVQKSLARLVLNDFVNGRTPNYSSQQQEKLKTVEEHRHVELQNTIFDKKIEKEFIDVSKDIFHDKTEKSLLISKNVGNMYTPSLYSCLASIFISHSIEELSNKRIGLFSYGSGLASSMFSFHICNISNEDSKRKLLNLCKGLSEIPTKLESRHMVTPKEFTEAMELREASNLKADYKCQANSDQLFPGTYYLVDVDEKFRRNYKRKPLVSELNGEKRLEHCGDFQ